MPLIPRPLLILAVGADLLVFGWVIATLDAFDAGDNLRQDPLNPIRYNAKRLSSGDGGLDFGARRFSPDYKRFYQRDSFTSASADLGLSGDAWNSNRYALAGGNPVTGVDLDGHLVIFICGFLTNCGSDPSGDRGRDTWGSVIAGLGLQPEDYVFFNWNATSAGDLFTDATGGERAASTTRPVGAAVPSLAALLESRVDL